ncbi:EpsI family protein [Thiohalocapsa marina]|uniref:EpsI family protein n=1 Tax=Thiohalocapsa marina TaxID=424902 RepID=A0A5M8FFJ9_9GAMM|nr:exosortase C-terminal domain/associated protein EpsI [Thiohalocapsa marina]KAA6183164.1 EpsI family protein [Thiohalocapsa marina]
MLRPILIAMTLLLATIAPYLLQDQEAAIAVGVNRHAPLDMNAAIPRVFGDWQERQSPLMRPADPATEGQVNEIYTQVVARTYINGQNEHIMLMLAYGSDQLTHKTHAHPQEDCYRAQGFRVSEITDDSIDYRGKELPVRRLLAGQDTRREVISYWTTVGTTARLPGWDRKIGQLKHLFTGKTPDGLLFRVSSLQTEGFDTETHDRFIRDMLDALPDEARTRLGVR